MQCPIHSPEFFVAKKVTICQRCGLGSCAQPGIPLLRSPLVMNQKSSPGLAFFTEALSSVGAGPIPCRLLPWHCAQFCEYSFLPPAAACAFPAYGFLASAAEVGAL